MSRVPAPVESAVELPKERVTEYKKAKQAKKRPQDLKGTFFGLFVPVLVAALIFGNSTVAFGVLLLALLLAALLLASKQTSRNLRAVFQHSAAQGAAAMLVPVMFLTGIFGSPSLMLLALAVFAAGLILAALKGSTLLANLDADGLGAGTMQPTAAPIAAQAQALPAQPSAEPLPDLRELCRGLPADLMSEVMVTVDALEAAQSSAKNSGDTRRIFDASQSLYDYLPATVSAWKNQSPEERSPAELRAALEQVRQIAQGSEAQSEQARQTWQTQRRFLEARAQSQAAPPELELKL